MNIKIVRTFTVLICGLVTTQLYQNCGKVGQFEMADESSLSSSSSNGTPAVGVTDQSHPDQKAVELPVQKVLVYNKYYVASLMRDIFATQANDTALEQIINTWIMNRPAPYGGGCNVYDSYSAKDCGGDSSNTNLPPVNDDNTVREAYRIQFCDNTLAQDIYLKAALAKASVNFAMAPDANSIASVYSLFYRDDAPTAATLSSLIGFDQTLASNNEKIIDRWRGILLQVCESPGWQLQ